MPKISKNGMCFPLFLDGKTLQLKILLFSFHRWRNWGSTRTEVSRLRLTSQLHRTTLLSCLHHPEELRAVTVERQKVQGPGLDITSWANLSCLWIFGFLQCTIYTLCSPSDSCPRNNLPASELNHFYNFSQLWRGEWSTYLKLESNYTYFVKILSESSLPESCFVSASCKCKFIKKYEKVWPLTLQILHKNVGKCHFVCSSICSTVFVSQKLLRKYMFFKN